MAKLTAWLVTVIGLVLILSELNAIPASLTSLQGWFLALAVTVIGIGKLIRNYKLM